MIKSNLEDRKLSHFIDVNGVQIYPRTMPGKVIQSNRERGEKPIMALDLITTPKRPDPEIQLRLFGSTRTETFGYLSSDPKEWPTWGRIYIPISEIDKMIKFLEDCRDLLAKKPGPLHEWMR